MAEAEHWLPSTTSSAADNSGSQDRIGRRKRVRHGGVRVGSEVARRPWSIDVSHLEWHDEGLCRYTDPEAFFPERVPDKAVLEICEACPVKQNCLDQAMADPTITGVWGGTTQAERERMRGYGRAVRRAEYEAEKKARAAS